MPYIIKDSMSHGDLDGDHYQYVAAPEAFHIGRKEHAIKGCAYPKWEDAEFHRSSLERQFKRPFFIEEVS